VDAATGEVLAGQRGLAFTLNAPTEMGASAVVRLAAGQAVALQAEQGSGRDLALLGSGQQTSLALQFLSP